jgi:hypothetical protein
MLLTIRIVARCSGRSSSGGCLTIHAGDDAMNATKR